MHGTDRQFLTECRFTFKSIYLIPIQICLSSVSTASRIAAALLSAAADQPSHEQMSRTTSVLVNSAVAGIFDALQQMLASGRSAGGKSKELQTSNSSAYTQGTQGIADLPSKVLKEVVPILHDRYAMLKSNLNIAAQMLH
jgi:hypothetical protein